MNPSPEWLEKIEKMAGEVCHREGCFLYDLEFVGSGNGRTLRVFVDKEAGAGIDDCSNVSKGLNLLLDGEDVIPGGQYHLEVSTPGIDRPLKKPWHFEKAIGKKIWIRTSEAFENLGVSIEHLKKAKQMEEVLQSVEDGNLVFAVKKDEVRLPISALEKSKIVFEFKQVKKK
jgi:ribosome maturation factor RimP